MSVFDLRIGGEGVISSVAVEGTAGERLQSLGVVRGARITCIAFSMFRGSVLIAVGGNRIAIRKEVADKISIECADGEGDK